MKKEVHRNRKKLQGEGVEKVHGKARAIVQLSFSGPRTLSRQTTVGIVWALELSVSDRGSNDCNTHNLLQLVATERSPYPLLGGTHKQAVGSGA